MNYSKKLKFQKPYYWNKVGLYKRQINMYRSGLISFNGSHILKFFKQFKLGRSVLPNYTLPTTKLNVRSRFESQILYCQSFIKFWQVEVKKFRAQKFELLGTLIRFSQPYLILIKNDFYTRYLHSRDQHKMQKPMENRKIVVIREFILHFSNVF